LSLGDTRCLGHCAWHRPVAGDYRDNSAGANASVPVYGEAAHTDWLRSGGNTAHEAERQTSRLQAFQAADPAHIDLFVAANVRLWDEIAN
jgi:hypothetical protein